MSDQTYSDPIPPTILTRGDLERIWDKIRKDMPYTVASAEVSMDIAEALRKIVPQVDHEILIPELRPFVLVNWRGMNFVPNADLPARTLRLTFNIL